MQYFKQLKRLIIKVDVFGTSKLLRFKNQGQYNTLTGGCVTIILLILFLSAFISNFKEILEQKNINFTQSLIYSAQPQETSYVIGEDKFIFGYTFIARNHNYTIQLQSRMISQTYIYGKLEETTIIEMEPCKQQLWSRINEIGALNFKKYHIQKYLCPKKGQKISMQGKFSSQKFIAQRLSVAKCGYFSNRTDCNHTNSSVLFGIKFYLMLPYVNYNQVNPISYYMQDRIYYQFTTEQRSLSTIYLNQNIITTDTSLLPFSSQKVQKTIQMRFQPIRQQNQFQPGVCLNIALRKQQFDVSVQRNFKKLDQLLSYLGGLFGSAILLFFILNFYSQNSYQIQVGNQIYSFQKEQPLNQKNFNFFIFIFYSIYRFLKFFGCKIQSKSMQTYDKCREQVEQQLDITLLLNKISFLQNCVTTLFEQHQLRLLFFLPKPKVQEAQKIRKFHSINSLIHKKSLKVQKGQIKKTNIFNKLKNQIGKKHTQIIKKDNNIDYKSNHDKNKNQIQMKQSFPSDRISNKNNNHQNPLKPKTFSLLDVFMTLANTQKHNSLENNNKDTIIAQQINTQNKISQENQSQTKDIFLPESLNDIKRLMIEAQNGNLVSKRIYDKLNHDLFQEHLLILRCFDYIFTNQQNVHQTQGSQINDKCEEILKQGIRNLNLGHEYQSKKENKEKRQINSLKNYEQPPNTQCRLKHANSL